MDDILARILRSQGLPEDWQGPPMPQQAGMVGPPMEGMGSDYRNPAGASSSSFAQPMPMPQQQQFPGPAFKPPGQEDDYRQRVGQIMKADRLGRAMQAGEGGMSDALKLILTTGSHIRSGAPPVPNLGGDTAGKAMTDRTALRLGAEAGGLRSMYAVTPEERLANRILRERGLGISQQNTDLRQTQGSARLEDADLNRELQERKFGYTQERGNRVGEASALAIGDLVSIVDNVDKVRQGFRENPDTIGPWAGRWNNIVRKVGLGDPESDVLLAQIDAVVFKELYQLSGKQINEAERADLKQTVFDAAKNGDSFEALVENYDNRVRMIISNKLRALKATGRDTTGLEGMVPGRGVRVRNLETDEEGTWTPDEPGQELDETLYERIE